MNKENSGLSKSSEVFYQRNFKTQESMKRFLYICSTVACVLLLFPLHPLFYWAFSVIGAFVVSKLVIDTCGQCRSYYRRVVAHILVDSSSTSHPILTSQESFLDKLRRKIMIYEIYCDGMLIAKFKHAHDRDICIAALREEHYDDEYQWTIEK
jgi:hypothetical protein